MTESFSEKLMTFGKLDEGILGVIVQKVMAKDIAKMKGLSPAVLAAASTVTNVANGYSGDGSDELKKTLEFVHELFESGKIGDSPISGADRGAINSLIIMEEGAWYVMYSYTYAYATGYRCRYIRRRYRELELERSGK